MKIAVPVVALSIMIIFGFQNCGGMNSKEGASPAESSLSSLQHTVQQTADNPGTTVAQLNATLALLQTILAQVNAVDPITLPADIQHVRQDLIQQIQNAITAIQKKIADQGGAVPPAPPAPPAPLADE
jgi:hypothetical protein